MQDFYERLIEEGEGGIARLIAERAQEGLMLDFKEKTDPMNGSFNEADKKVLAKALSAFSNSAGGVIVYGLKAKPLHGGIDCVQGPPIPIRDIERFRSEAVTLAGSLLQPRHDGIEVEMIAAAHPQGSGYLVIKVPRSERRPHRSEAKDQKQYFKRSGDGSYAMEHYDIEDAFKRVSVPELELAWSAEPISTTGDGVTSFNIELILFNQSRYTAKFPYVHISHMEGASYSPLLSIYQSQVEGAWRCFFAGADQVVNPGTKSLVVRLNANIKRDKDGRVSMSSNRITFNYRMGCENSQMKEDAFEISYDDLAQALGPTQP